MTHSTHTAVPELQRFLGRAIFRLRWATLAITMLLALLVARSTAPYLPMWAFVGIFMSYNFIADMLRRVRPSAFSFLRLAVCDLLMAGLLYVLGAEPGGPLFILLVLAVDSAAATLTVVGALLYTCVIAVLVTLMEAGMGGFMSIEDATLLGTRLVMLALLGIGMAILTRRLMMEQHLALAARDQANQLAILERVRGEFIATVSHELRTPLTSSRAALVLLDASARERHQPEEHALLENARRNIERLNVLIGDLLAYNQLEAGTLRLVHEPCDLCAIVTNAMVLVHPLLREKEQAFDVDLPASLPVFGDAARLEQVVLNVLANAHHHTPRGTRISIHGHACGQETLLSVHDQGLGIDPEEFERIFERFYRLGATQGGSGLGLAIAQHIMHLHKGKIWVESAPGAGATFWLSLPGA